MALLVVAGCSGPEARDGALVGTDTGVDWESTSSTGFASGDDDAVDDTADGPVFDLAPTQWPDPDVADVPPPAIRGGTMTLGRDGARMFVGDEFRDAVHVLDVANEVHVGSIEHPGCHPGRVRQAADDAVVFLCTASGELVYADPDAFEVVEVVEVCANPRGLALSEDGAAWVACAEGQVIEVRDGAVVSQLEVGVELRDVVDVGPPLMVSTFREPSVLTLDAAGDVIDAEQPGLVAVAEEQHTVPFDQAPRDAVGPLQPNVSRRVLQHEGQSWMLHQSARVDEGIALTGGWGGGLGCVGSQNAALSWTDPQTGAFVTEVFPGMSVVFDVAVDPVRQRYAVAGGVGDWATVIREPAPGAFTVVATCEVFGEHRTESMMTAVAFDADGRLWAHSPDANLIKIWDMEAGLSATWIALEGDAIKDSGLELFHKPTLSGIACVSCHPEGRDDGLRWALESDEPRRTMSLAGRLEGGAPFHWGGEQPDFASLDDTVRVDAMGGADRGAAYVDVFERYLFALAAMAPAGDQDPAEVQAGAQLFSSLGCEGCHQSPRYDAPANVGTPGGGSLQVPSLLGVRYGAPYMHDGRSEDLEAALDDMLGFTTPPVEATAQERVELLAFLRTL